MTDRKKKTNIWLIIGAILLIALIIYWLWIAMFTGDTDVAAFIPALPALFA